MQNEYFEKGLQKMKLSPFEFQNILLDNKKDLYNNSLNKSRFADARCYSIEEAKSKFSCSNDKSFSIPYLKYKRF